MEYLPNSGALVLHFNQKIVEEAMKNLECNGHPIPKDVYVTHLYYAAIWCKPDLHPTRFEFRES